MVDQYNSIDILTFIHFLCTLQCSGQQAGELMIEKSRVNNKLMNVRSFMLLITFEDVSITALGVSLHTSTTLKPMNLTNI
jgi:hypothetical protein